MTEHDERKQARSPEVILSHKERLIRVLATGDRNASALAKMQSYFPDYTQGYLNYDRGKLRKAWKSKVIENYASEQTKELERLDVMLEMAVAEYEIAKRNVVRDLSSSTQKYMRPAVMIDEIVVQGPELVEVERTESQKEVANNEMVKFWWKEIRDVQSKIVALKGLNHINVNIKQEKTVFVKGYVNFKPHEVWPNIEPPPANIIEGDRS